MATTFNPKNFALTAGDELDVAQYMPRVFGYYADQDAMAQIFPGGTNPGDTNQNFFGLRTDGSGAPLTEAEKKLPSAAPQFNRGSAIMVYGKHQTYPAGSADYDKIFIVYLYVTSLPKKDTTYTVAWSYIE